MVVAVVTPRSPIAELDKRTGNILLTREGYRFLDQLNTAITDVASTIITQSITNGLTGQAPSSDAVYDALALKQNASTALKTTDLGVSVQGYDAMLAAMAGLISTAGSFIRFSGADTPVIQAIVGTVSQSGGTPTGALQEYGSNANGEYARFANGLQVCWGNMAYSGDINTGAAGGFRSATTDLNLTFPAAFAATPWVGASVPFNLTSAQQIFGTTIRNPSSTDVIILVLRVTSSTSVSATVYWHAVGRWF